LGEGIELNAGKFGPYIKCGGKSVSLRGTDNIFNMTQERAKELLAGAKEKPSGKSLGVYPKNKQDIVLMMGRYGPYLKCGRTNYALPKNISGHEPSLEEAIKIIEAKK
jgi:DNA topoisomerase-1